MFAQARLTEIAARKRLLVAQSHLQRTAVEVQFVQAAARLGWVASAGQKLRSHAGWLIPGAAVAGLLAARHWRPLAKWIPIGISAWRWFQRLKPDGFVTPEKPDGM